MFTIENYEKAFKALGLVPIDVAIVLNRFKVRLRAPLGPLPLETLWQSKTLSNTLEFRSQLKLIRDSIT